MRKLIIAILSTLITIPYAQCQNHEAGYMPPSGYDTLEGIDPVGFLPNDQDGTWSSDSKTASGDATRLDISGQADEHGKEGGKKIDGHATESYAYIQFHGYAPSEVFHMINFTLKSFGEETVLA